MTWQQQSLLLRVLHQLEKHYALCETDSSEEYSTGTAIDDVWAVLSQGA